MAGNYSGIQYTYPCPPRGIEEVLKHRWAQSEPLATRPLLIPRGVGEDYIIGKRTINFNSRISALLTNKNWDLEYIEWLQ